MTPTTVVFVHGFVSGPECWKPFLDKLGDDARFPKELYRFVTFPYPTEFIEMNMAKRIAGINDCGSSLGLLLDTEYPDGTLMLVGHSMGGLVIQSMLAQKIAAHRGKELERIRSVILFATPNRGSMILNNVRSVFGIFRKNAQEEDLRVLNPEVDRNCRVIEECFLNATAVTRDSCPIPFRVFWGSQDDVVSEVSARGPFSEASSLPGGHSEILDGNPKNPDPKEQEYGRMRYGALTDALLHPVGHPKIYELDLLEATLTVYPFPVETAITLQGLDRPKEIHTDNVATRLMRFEFSKQNRCCVPWDQTYRSDDGFVEPLSLTEPNGASMTDQSEYTSAGKRFMYVFTPEPGETFLMKLKIYNGFAEGQRQWHDHFKLNARVEKVRFTLDLTAFHDAGYEIEPAPSLCYRTEDMLDKTLLADRDPKTALACVTPSEPWLRTWEIGEVKGGTIEVVWDLMKKTA